MNTQKLKDIVANEKLTDSQLARKISALASKWVKDNSGNPNYPISFTRIRGIYHFYNCAEYGFTAKNILESLTGFEFRAINNYMAKLISPTL